MYRMTSRSLGSNRSRYTLSPGCAGFAISCCLMVKTIPISWTHNWKNITRATRSEFRQRRLDRHAPWQHGSIRRTILWLTRVVQSSTHIRSTTPSTVLSCVEAPTSSFSTTFTRLSIISVGEPESGRRGRCSRTIVISPSGRSSLSDSPTSPHGCRKLSSTKPSSTTTSSRKIFSTPTGKPGTHHVGLRLFSEVVLRGRMGPWPPFLCVRLLDKLRG